MANQDAQLNSSTDEQSNVIVDGRTNEAVGGKTTVVADERAASSVQRRKAALKEKSNEEKKIAGHQVRQGDIFKIVGLVVFLAIVVLTGALLWPYMHDLFEPGGVDRVIDDVRSAGPWGFLILLALQFLQIVIAFIPGEVTQMAAGMLYGPWLGGLVILVGCIISSAFVFVVVHKLGAPFVRDMVPEKWMKKFDTFQESGKLELTVFVLFLIPAMPKDVFTYLVPLTSMRMRTFMVLSNVGRIPGILVTTYAASGLVDGNLWQSVVIFVVFAAVAVVCLIFRERLMGKMAGSSKNKQN
jgi:uncharacterized membrane protein YdjX (TVP38/TMEM64 family)